MPLQDWDACLFKACREDMLEGFQLLVKSICMTYPRVSEGDVLNLRNQNDKGTPKGATVLMVSCQHCNDLWIPEWIELHEDVDIHAKDNEGKDVMDYIHSNKKCRDKLEELFGAKFLQTNETLGGHAEGGRTSYLKM